MENTIPSINLARKSRGTLFDQFISWVLTIGRLIIILTELIALGAFLYRFSLDRQLIDLHDKIKQKETIVSNFKNNESKFRNLQERIETVAKIESQGAKKIKVLSDIINFSSGDVIFDSLIISEDSIKIDAKISSVSSLSNFIRYLKTYPAIQTVSLDRIENKTSIGIIAVSITGVMKTDKPAFTQKITQQQ